MTQNSVNGRPNADLSNYSVTSLTCSVLRSSLYRPNLPVTPFNNHRQGKQLAWR